MSISPGQLNKGVVVQHYANGRWQHLWYIHSQFTAVSRVIFSRHANAAPGGEFIIRRCGVTLDMALADDENTYLITQIEDVNRNYIKLTAAAVSPVLLTGTQTRYVIGPMNRPQVVDDKIKPFEGVIAERYSNSAQEQPNIELTTGLVLTTPKSIRLTAGSVIDDGEAKYIVRYAHMHEKHYNDYEIERKDDA